MKTEPSVQDLRKDFSKECEERKRRRIALQKIIDNETSFYERMKLYIRRFFSGD